MPVFKNESNGTWYVMARYVNWKGERKQKCKRGFATKKEAQELSVSKPYAYKLIRQLNEELKAKGFITISGRVNRQYFYERLYGAGKGDE